MKRFLTLSTSLLIVLVGCGVDSAVAYDETGNAKTVVASSEATTPTLFSLVFGLREEKPMGLIAQDAADRTLARLKMEIRQQKLDHNAELLEAMVGKTKKYVGRTWYVPSGASPSGWDCSGLVTWAYAQIGEDLYHSASVQKKSGKKVEASEAKLGDVVAFGWKGYSGAQHTGIYLGDGKMLHAGGRVGMRTEVADISDWAKGSGNTLITYTRILDN
jgi:cell wall-associated NlpC family hydrolase